MTGLILLVVVFVALAGIVTIWRRALRRPGADGARCGQCGYRVAGLETLSCPECGGDLREVGIRTPQREFISPVAFVLWWTLLLPIPALVLSTLLQAVVPTEGRVVSRVELATPRAVLPTVELVQVMRATVPRGQRLSVGGAGITQQSGPEGTTSTLAPPVVNGPVIPETIELELRHRRRPYGAGAPVAPLTLAVSGGLLDPERLASIEPWVRRVAAADPLPEGAIPSPDPAADPDTAPRPDPTLEEVAADVTLVVSMLAGAGPPCTLTAVVPGQSRMLVKSRAGHPAWVTWATFGGWPVVYVAGLWLFFRIRRTRVAADGGAIARTGGGGRS